MAEKIYLADVRPFIQIAENVAVITIVARNSQAATVALNARHSALQSTMPERQKGGSSASETDVAAISALDSTIGLQLTSLPQAAHRVRRVSGFR